MDNKASKETPKKKDVLQKIENKASKIVASDMATRFVNNAKNSALSLLSSAIYELFNNLMKAIFPGVNIPNNRPGPVDRASYTGYYAQNGNINNYTQSRGSSISFTNDRAELIPDQFTKFQDRRDADDFLGELRVCINRFGYVSVNDFKDIYCRMFNVNPKKYIDNYTDNDYGWRDLRLAQIVAIRGGYQLLLPTISLLPRTAHR